MESNYGRGGVTSNEDVLRNFCTNTNEVKANNLSTHYDNYNDQVLLRQYGVLIATRKGDKVMITSKRFSVTTSKVQNELLRIAMEYGLDVQKTNEFAKGGMSRKCELGDNVFVKSKGLSGIVARVNGESCYVKFGGNLSKHDGTYNMNDLKIEESSLFMDDYAKGGEVDSIDYYEQLAVYVQGVGSIYNGTSMRKAIEQARAYERKNPNAEVVIVDEKYGDEYDSDGNMKENYAKGGKVFGAEKFWNELSSKEKMEWLKKRRDIPSDYKSSLSRDSFEKLPDWIKLKVKKAFADNKIYKYGEGGDIAQGNYEMMLSQAKEVEHHVEELQNILKGEKDIDAWVVAKMENVSSTLSDITHYLDGKTEYAHGGKMSRGGYFGKDALVKDLSEEFASEELLAKFRKKSGIKDTQLTKPNVIAFAYTDYGGDFMDKVAIEYFLENHPKNIVVENTGYSGQNAIVWGKVAMDWVKATEDYAFGYEDFESFYYDKVYKEEEQAFSEYLYQLQRDGYELDYDEVLQWLLENKGGYFSITTQGLDFYDGDLTNELLEEGLIEKSEEYAKGGKMKTTSNISHYKVRDEIFVDYMDAMNYCDEIGISYDEIEKTKEYAKGGNIKSKTNKKMATKKTNDGQTAPQIKRWLFAGSKGGYNYYNIEKRPYKKPVDEEKKGAPVGYRFSKYAEEKGITNNRFRKPTKAEVQQYAGKKKNGKLIMYRETRSNKSDVNPKKKI